MESPLDQEEGTQPKKEKNETPKDSSADREKEKKTYLVVPFDKKKGHQITPHSSPLYAF